MIKAIKGILQTQYTSTTVNPLKDNDSEMEVTLSNMPDNCLKFRVPRGGKAHLGMVANHTGYKESCDFVILVPQDTKTDVYFIELKATKNVPSPEKPFNQIIHTLPIFEYLARMAEIHHSETEKIEKHFVVIFGKISKSLDKQKTKPRPVEKRKFKGRRFKIFYSTTVPFDELQ